MGAVALFDNTQKTAKSLKADALKIETDEP